MSLSDLTEADVVAWLETKNASLLGKAVDVTKREGREWFASWFIDILRQVERGALNER